jgi:hypothetical protein
MVSSHALVLNLSSRFRLNGGLCQSAPTVRPAQAFGAGRRYDNRRAPVASQIPPCTTICRIGIRGITAGNSALTVAANRLISAAYVLGSNASDEDRSWTPAVGQCCGVEKRGQLFRNAGHSLSNVAEPALIVRVTVDSDLRIEICG